MEIYNRCSLCFKGGTEEFYNKLINIDSLQLCPKCYQEYNKSEYHIKAMLCNSIKMYRKKIENDFIPKSKVKEKIEELDKEEKRELKGTKGQDRYYIKQKYMYKRKVLEELLREE